MPEHPPHSDTPFRDAAWPARSESLNSSPEAPDIGLGLPVVIAALVVVLVITAMLISAWLLLPHYRQQGEIANAPPSPLAFVKGATPAPHLQYNPTQDLSALRAREQKQLSSYGWVDRSAGIVHIPIDRAMRLIAEKGIPADFSKPPASDRAKAAEENE